MTEFDCSRFEDLIEEYRTGALSSLELSDAERHLSTCARCRQSLRLWTGFVESVDDAAPAPLPPLVERSIVVAAADARPFAPKKGRLAVAFASGFALAAAAAVALVMSGVFADGLPPEAESKRAMDAPPAADDGARRPIRMDDGRLVVRLDDVTSLWVDGDSDFALEKLSAAAVRVRLVRGRVVADIGPHEGPFRFVVATPDGEVEAKGTIFAVEVAPSGKTVTRVLRGLVEVRETRRQGAPRAFLVGVGEKGEIGGGAPLRTTRWETEGDFCLLRGCPGKQVAVEPAQPPPPQSTIADEGEATGAKTASIASASEAENDTGAPGAPTPARPSSQQEKAAQAAPEERPSSQPKNPAAADLVAQALGLRKLGDYSGAAKTYRALIETYPQCLESQNALVSLGQLELSNLGDPASAKLRFDHYLARAPGGILAEEARLGKVRALAASGRFSEVIAASDEYLSRHPAGYAGAEVFLRRGDARRAQGDCAGALEDYAKLEALWPTAPEVTRAERGIAACAARRPDTERD